MASVCEIIETQRLLFRGIEEQDAAFIVELRSDPDVYKFFRSPHLISIDEHINWYKNSYLINVNRFDWICIEKDTGKKIGVFGLVLEERVAELNYLLSPEAQHKGFATEGVKRLIEYAKDKWPVHSVIAEIHKDNVPSLSLVQRVGFKFVRNNGDFSVYAVEV